MFGLSNMPAEKKMSWSRVIARAIIAIGMIAALLYYMQGKNVTISDFTNAVASTPAVMIIAFEALDYFTDQEDYYKLYATFGRIGGSRLGGAGGALLGGILTSVIVFAAVLYLIGGTLTMQLGAYSPAVMLWAGIVAIYTMLPNTGDDPLLLYIYIAAVIVTHKFVLLPLLHGINIPGVGI